MNKSDKKSSTIHDLLLLHMHVLSLTTLYSSETKCLHLTLSCLQSCIIKCFQYHIKYLLDQRDIGMVILNKSYVIIFSIKIKRYKSNACRNKHYNISFLRVNETYLYLPYIMYILEDIILQFSIVKKYFKSLIMIVFFRGLVLYIFSKGNVFVWRLFKTLLFEKNQHLHVY